MHDGSLLTLKDVMIHYNNGGVIKAGDRRQRFSEWWHTSAKSDRCAVGRSGGIYEGTDQFLNMQADTYPRLQTERGIRYEYIQ